MNTQGARLNNDPKRWRVEQNGGALIVKSEGGIDREGERERERVNENIIF